MYNPCKAFPSPVTSLSSQTGLSNSSTCSCSMVATVSLAACARRGRADSSSSCILAASSAVCRSCGSRAEHSESTGSSHGKPRERAVLSWWVLFAQCQVLPRFLINSNLTPWCGDQQQCLMVPAHSGHCFISPWQLVSRTRLLLQAFN